MTRVLLVGIDPSMVDFSDPGLPPGLDEGKIRAGVDAALAQMRERGWTADHRYITPDQASAVAAVREDLSKAHYDCLVIGGGVRMPATNLFLLEALINLVRTASPATAIGFNTTPLNSADAVDRVLT